MKDSILHFDYPREPDSYSMDLEYYKACNGDNPDVTVPHIVGKPSSYLHLAQMKQIRESNGGRGLYTTDTFVRAGIGNGGCTSQNTEMFTSNEKNFDWNLSAMVSGEEKIPIGPVSLTIGGGGLQLLLLGEASHNQGSLHRGRGTEHSRHRRN